MKKCTLLSLVVLLCINVNSYAQKSPEVFQKQINAAKLAVMNPKKAKDPASWAKLGKLYLDAYNAPSVNVIPGSKSEVMLILSSSGEKVISSSVVTLMGEEMTKEEFENKNLYFDGAGNLRYTEITRPIDANLLENAKEAYSKAFLYDEKGKVRKNISDGLKKIADNALNEAWLSYATGDLLKASSKFEFSANTRSLKPLSIVDSGSYYNAAYTAYSANDLNKAKSLFSKCQSIKYYFENGDVFAKLADIYLKEGNLLMAREQLEQGFQMFPQSQPILIGLINSYLENKDDPQKLFNLIAKAKNNEPNNASLHYVEGNIYKEFGKEEEALKAYGYASKVDASYEYGYIGAALLYVEKADKISEQAQNEMNNQKYEALVAEYTEVLKSAAEQFESAIEITKDSSLKKNIAQYLKNIYYRFIDKDIKYQELYDKYKAMAE